MLTITNSAVQRITDILVEESPNTKLRIFVQGGGCSGFNYGFTTDTEVNEDDFIVENTNDTLIIDSMSMQYLAGATVDYVEDLMGSSFKIDNPNAETTCGCGSSFNVGNDFYDQDFDFH